MTAAAAPISSGWHVDVDVAITVNKQGNDGQEHHPLSSPSAIDALCARRMLGSEVSSTHHNFVTSASPPWLPMSVDNTGKYSSCTVVNPEKPCLARDTERGTDPEPGLRITGRVKSEK